MFTIDMSNRRQWLKRAALASAAAASAPLTLRAKVNRFAPAFVEYLPNLEWERQLAGMPKLRARMLANEHPYGPSPMCVEAVRATADRGNRYQHEEAMLLKTQIAEYEGVSEDNIILAPGSSDVLEKMSIIHFLDGGNVVSADPAYMSLIKVTMGMGGEWNKVPLKKDWSHDLKGMKKAINADTKMVYICNPNNPTGTITDAEELRAFCADVATPDMPVFVDEAYLEFLPDYKEKSMVPLINEGHNVIVARTFSKVHGMAGLRVGYGVATPETLEKVYKITRGNMGLCKSSVVGASASMKDTERQAETVKQTAAFRDQIYAGLEKMGMEYVPSHTSFVLFPIEMEGKAFLEKMFDQGVGVRAFKVYAKDYCRVSVGTPEEVSLFLGALQTTLAK